MTNRYREGLESWALQAVAAADPLRRAQLVFSRAGREYVIDAEWGADGTLGRVRHVRSRFHGQGPSDNAEASLKQQHLGLREWELAPSMVDLRWFAAYLTERKAPSARASHGRSASRSSPSGTTSRRTATAWPTRGG